MPTNELSVYDRLIDLLDSNRATYRLIDHPPEGRTELVSAFRGHPVSKAAKCMIVMVKLGKKVTRFVLAVVPGDARVDLAALKALYGGTHIAFASPDVAESLSGCVIGTVLPFASGDRLELIADPGLFENDEIFFNAGRLDRSIALSAADYRRVANPRLAAIALAAS